MKCDLRLLLSAFAVWPVLAGAQNPTSAAEPPTIQVKSVVVEPALPEGTEDMSLLDPIEVTGSRIRRTDYESAQPIFSITREAIAQTGMTSLGELLQDLPIAGSASNNSVYNSEVGAIEIDLRNLGSQRVLVLLNGRRWVGGMSYFSTSSVDLSTIPLSAVERVEILKDGASAVYGSDAIAGVVNVITRQDPSGMELNAQIGGFREGDGLSTDLGISWGAMLGPTSLFIDLSHSRQKSVRNADRELTRNYRSGAGPTRGTPFSPRGTLIFVPTPENAAILGEDLCPSDPGSGTPLCNMILRRGETITGAASEDAGSVAQRYEPFNSSSLDESINDLDDPNAVFLLSQPSERTSLFGTVKHRLRDDLIFSTELFYSHRHLEQHVPFYILFGDFSAPPHDAIYLAADNPFNPFDQDIGRTDTQGFGSGIVLRALGELTPRIIQSSMQSWRTRMALDGELEGLDRLFEWQTGWISAQNRNPEATLRRVILENLRLALGPVTDCAATPDCVPLNVLGGPSSMTQPMLDYITYESEYPKKQSLDTAWLTVAHDLFTLPAGVVEAAYGVEYRRESYSDSPDELVTSCRSGCFAPTAGSFSVNEEYAELGVPLLESRRFARALDLSLAVRHSRYNTFGDDTNYKIGLSWKPVDNFLLRGTLSTAFRAPGISDLYLTAAELTFTSLSDPCSDYAGQQGGAPASETVQGNCRGAGVPESYVQPATIPGHDGGNPKLRPESARTSTGGIVYSPAFMPDLNLYLDWYRIELENSITRLDPQAVLDTCYRPEGGSESCSLVDRDAESGAITDLRFQPLNIGANHVEGIDASLDFLVPGSTDRGRFKLRLDGSYLIESSIILADSSGTPRPTSQEGTATPLNAFPRVKANVDLQWLRGEWKASWRARYIHSMTENCDDGIVPTFTELGLCSHPDAEDPQRSRNELDATVYHDVQIAYAMPGQRTEITFGIRNLFNQQPPASYTNFYNAFDASTYDLPGHFVYLRFFRSL